MSDAGGETERFRTLGSGSAGLLPHICSMRDVYRFCNTKRITKFTKSSSRFCKPGEKSVDTRTEDEPIAVQQRPFGSFKSTLTTRGAFGQPLANSEALFAILFNKLFY
ncbi:MULTISPECIES: hypothetical protein [unclassified Bradyrhizobium]